MYESNVRVNQSRVGSKKEFNSKSKSKTAFVFVFKISIRCTNNRGPALTSIPSLELDKQTLDNSKALALLKPKTPQSHNVVFHTLRPNQTRGYHQKGFRSRRNIKAFVCVVRSPSQSSNQEPKFHNGRTPSLCAVLLELLVLYGPPQPTACEAYGVAFYMPSW